jgi:hypothetical protein
MYMEYIHTCVSLHCFLCSRGVPMRVNHSVPELVTFVCLCTQDFFSRVVGAGASVPPGNLPWFTSPWHRPPRYAGIICSMRVQHTRAMHIQRMSHVCCIFSVSPCMLSRVCSQVVSHLSRPQHEFARVLSQQLTHYSNARAAEIRGRCDDSASGQVAAQSPAALVECTISALVDCMISALLALFWLSCHQECVEYSKSSMH